MVLLRSQKPRKTPPAITILGEKGAITSKKKQFAMNAPKHKSHENTDAIFPRSFPGPFPIAAATIRITPQITKIPIGMAMYSPVS